MKLWWRIWFLALLAKLMLATLLPLTPDEAYYWVWSQHPQLSYYDHPPAVAWLFWLGSHLPQFAVRWPGILIGHLGLWVWCRALADFLDERQLNLWLTLSLLMPLIGPGSLVVTPDLPLVASWGFSLYAFQRLLQSGGQISAASLLGVALGFGLLSKYHIVLMGPILAIWWFMAKPKFSLWRWLPVTLLLALLVSSPVWIWNWQNDWASFRFQVAHGLGRTVWKPSWTMEYVLAQVGLVFPTLIFLACKSTAPRPWKVVAWFPLIFFVATSFRGYVEANWPIVAHPALLALALTPLRNRRWMITLPAAIWAAGLAGVLILAALPHWPPIIMRTKLAELRSYDAAVAKGSALSPLYASSYQIASITSFRLGRPVYKLAGVNRRDFFDSLPESNPRENRFFLLKRTHEDLPDPWRRWWLVQTIEIDPNFEVWELLKP